MADISQEIKEKTTQSWQDKVPLRIAGGGSKSFYGNACEGEPLSVTGHAGVIDYDPTELVITARAGTPLKEIEATLAECGQCLPFEPPHFGEGATLGGTIACGFSGPSRPYLGSARDFMLGCKIINGKGEILQFGGRVIKNVAGYDVSRLMTGAMGTLGVILEVSLKVLPKPEQEISLSMGAGIEEAIDIMNARAGQPVPLTAACYDGEALVMRMSGNEQAIKEARRMVAGEELQHGDDFWRQLREHQHFFFDDYLPLWRLSLAPSTLPLAIPGNWFFDWGGALRWLKSDADARDIRDAVQGEGGHATLFRNGNYYAQRDGGDAPAVFHTLEQGNEKIHQRLKSVFDPRHILNRHIMYKDKAVDEQRVVM